MAQSQVLSLFCNELIIISLLMSALVLSCWGYCTSSKPLLLLLFIFAFQALQKDVNNRLGYSDLGGEEAKKHIFFRNINWPQLEAGMFKPPFVPDVRILVFK